MVATGPLSDAERSARRRLRRCLAEALKGDEVYVVTPWGCDPIVFGHEDDAVAYRSKNPASSVSATTVLDHADARRLIEQEEG